MRQCSRLSGRLSGDGCHSLLETGEPLAQSRQVHGHRVDGTRVLGRAGDGARGRHLVTSRSGVFLSGYSSHTISVVGVKALLGSYELETQWQKSQHEVIYNSACACTLGEVLCDAHDRQGWRGTSINLA